MLGGGPGAAVCPRRSPHGPAELLVGHAAVFLLLAPQLGHGLGAQELEDALPPVLPLHEALVELRVDEDVPDELPQVRAPGGCKARASAAARGPQHVLTDARRLGHRGEASTTVGVGPPAGTGTRGPRPRPCRPVGARGAKSLLGPSPGACMSSGGRRPSHQAPPTPGLRAPLPWGRGPPCLPFLPSGLSGDSLLSFRGRPRLRFPSLGSPFSPPGRPSVQGSGRSGVAQGQAGPGTTRGESPPSLTAVGGLAIGRVEVHVTAPGVRGVGALRGGRPWGRGPSEPLTARTLCPCSSQEPRFGGCSPGARARVGEGRLHPG